MHGGSVAISFHDHLRALRRPAAPVLTTRRLFRSKVIFGEIVGSAGHGMTDPFPYDEAYLVAVRLVEGRHARVLYDGQEARRYDLRRGAMHIHDLRRRPQVEVLDPFHTLNAYLPRSFLVAFCEHNNGRFQDFPGDHRASAIDPTVEALLCSLQPALQHPHEATTLFLDHVSMALAAHLCGTYGTLSRVTPLGVGGLSALHLQRCLMRIEDELDSDITLEMLAGETGLSNRHFTRLFVRSMGMPPHRYLLERRVARARQLLGEPQLSLSEVAQACGFADQSHFTRVFSCAMGKSPGAYRRAVS